MKDKEIETQVEGEDRPPVIPIIIVNPDGNGTSPLPPTKPPTQQ